LSLLFFLYLSPYRVQKKTFTKWVNKHLIKVRKHITDLYEDLRDGHNLISLLEVLSGVTLVRIQTHTTHTHIHSSSSPREKGRMRFHRLQNVQIALDFLKQRQVKLVNIRNDDITDGNPKLTLGLIWTIILHFQISEIYVSGESGDLTAKEKLLLWTQQATEGYHGLRCVNFSSSWSDGRMFNALLHRYRPDLIDMEVVAHQTNRENLEQAFEIAESLGVTRLLDAEDVDVPSPDEKSVITYVSSIYDAFPKIPEGGEGIKPHEVDQQWAEYQSRFSSLLQWTRQHTALMANKGFPQNPVELKALYNEYIHFKETEIPAKELEKGHIKHLYKLLEVWIEFGRIKLPQGLHPNDLEEEWGKLILEMLEREKALRPAVERLELLLQKANKFQNMAVDCEEKLTLAKNTLQVDTSHLESGEPAQCEQELGAYLQDCEALVRQLHLDLQVLRDEKYYQVEQLAFRVTRLQEELVSLRLQCSSVYRKGHFSSGGLLGEQTAQRGSAGSLPTLGAQTLLGAIGAVATLMRQPMSRSDLVAISSSEDEGSLRFIYELLGWVEETQELLERAEWGSDLPSVEQHLQDHHTIHTTVEELLHSLKEARSYEPRVSPNFRSSYSETLAKLENQYCKLLEHSSWRLRCLESLRAFVSHCTEELIWLNEKEEEELAFDWSENTTNMTAKREQYTEMRSELEEKQKVMRSLQETADQLCQDNHPAKQTVEAYSAALQTQWQWVRQLCICVEQHLKDNTAYFLFMSDARECETYLRQLQDTIKRQYTCDKNSRLGKLEDLLQDSMEEKEQLIEYRSSVASLVGRAKTVVQLRPRSADCILGTTTPIRAICDYRQIEITVSKGEECVLEDNSQRTKWKIISPTGNEAMVPSVCFTVPPPNKEAIDTANRMEQLYQNVMSLWHQLHMNMKSVVTWHYLQKDINNILSWTLDTVRSQSLSERQQALEHLNTHLTDFLADSHESTLFTPSERRELEKEVANCGQHCQALLISMETVEKDESISRSYLSELQSIKSHLQEAEQRLMKGLQASPPSGLSGGGADTAIHIAEQEKLQQDLKGLQSDLGNVSRRCVSFFEEKPTSSSVPVLRSELNLAVEKIERLNSLSSVYLQKLKTVDVLMRSLQVAESQVKKYEGRLSEEDIVPADTTAIQALREQLNVKLEKQDHIFQSLSLEMQQAREAGTQLSQLHSDRSPEMDRYQEKAHQLTERWNGVRRQMETRLSDLEMLGSVLQQYRAGHSALIHWIEETTAKQENTQPEQTDSKALSEQLTQQTALVAEIEQNQVKLDECQNHSKHYCTAVKDYELQLMTFRAFVESTQKSPVKRRRMHSSSDAITQEFMDLRTRYTALVTLTTQHVKYISDALRRLEEEEKQVEEERQARVGEVSELLSWVKGLQERPAESSLAAQQVWVVSTLRAQVTSQLDDLTATYKQLCDSSAAQLQQLEEQLAKEEKRKDHKTVAGVIDLETMETFPVFQSARRGLIDQDTCRVLLESQLVMGGLLQPDSPQSLSLEESLATGLIDNCTYQSLLELETALHLVQQFQITKSQFIPVAAAVEMGHIKEQIALRILELQLSLGGLLDVSSNEILSLENAMTKGFLSVAVYNKLHSRLDRRELIDPNTAEKLNLSEFHQRCVLNQETGLRLLPVNQQSRGTVCLRSGRKVSVFRAVQEGLIDQQVTIRLLEAQLFAGGITDPRSGHRLTVDEAVRLGLMDQDLACALLTRQLQTGGIIDPASGERLELNEAIQRDLLSSRMALRVLESQWSFMGMIWPESGELLSISDALQQGVVSGELAWKFLSKRHFVGALYCPESGRVVPLACAEKILGTEVVEVLEKTRVPDALPAMISSGSLNVSRWGSSSSPLLSSPAFSPPHLHDDTSFSEGAGSEEQVKYRLLCYLMTHSYINAGSGERLVLLEPELIELICQPTKDQSRPEPHLGEPSDREKPDFSMPFSEPEQRNIENLTEAQKRNVTDNAVCETKKVKSPLEEDAAYEEKSSLVKNSDNALELAETVPEVQTLPSFIKQVSILPTNSVLDLFTKEVKEIKREETVLGLTDPRPLSIEMPKLNQCLLDEKEEAAPSKNKRLGTRTENTAADISFEDAAEESQDGQVDQNDRLDKINLLSIAREGVQVKKIEVTDISDQMDTYRNTETTDSSKIPKMLSMEQIDEDAELEDKAKQLLQGGLLTDGAQKLLLDKAVSQGVLLGHTAVKVMSKAGLFGGFLDVSACKSLSVEDVMQEGLLDEDLLKSVLQSEKTLAGVIDVEHNQICSLKDAAQTGLLDPDTVARLLEAQVVSGGIVDLRRGKKVSVTLAANFGLIEEAQKEDLLAMEKSCHGKSSNPYTSHTKLTLQLQMDGVVDPKTKQPLSLQQAIQKGIIGHKEAQQILMQQVAEGGIVHHGSGVRLSVADSVQQGLIDKSFVQKLEDFEKSCQRQEQFGSDPNSISVQASVGFICDSVSKSRLALTEAVSRGFIDEDTANKAMASPNVISGLLDPHSACIVPYSELINQGKIDIETGRRFLEVRPFRGVPQKQNGGMMTLPEAVKTGQVDPVPALRVLQSQADSGGIINISDGKRLTIPEAVEKGLVEKDIARVIATNQIVKGGLINPSSGHRVSDLKEAVQEGLISREMAAELQDNFDPVDEPSYKEEGTATVVPSTSGMYSPLVSNQVSHSNSQHESTEVSAAHLSESEKTDCMITEVLEAPQPEKTQLLQHYAPYEMEEQTHKVISSTDLEINTDASLEVLTHFALKTEKRLQQAIKDFDPDIYKELQHQPSESSLARQECLEHDQRILALLSMVRHTEVCLKQQHELMFLFFLFLQNQTLALELCDLEPQVNKELEASRQLLGSHLEDVPPQLLMALEKDGRSLSRAFDAARELSQSVQQGMKSHRDARKVRENIHLRMKTFFFQYNMILSCVFHLQELEEHLAARSSDVSTVAFDIQVFISECAQDLEPEQSRHLLRQLQQLQRAFHQATGRAHARAEALSVQQAREEEREQKEKEQEEREREKEKQTAMKKEAHLLQVAQSTRSLLEQPDSSVPPEEKQRLRVRLDQLQSQHQEHLQSCQEKLRRTESLRDDLTKFLQEHGTLGTWLEQSERGLCSIGQGEADAQLAEDVICHKADLRFVSISGQKVLDSVQGALERMGGTDPALEDIRQLVNDKLQDASHRYSSLQNKVGKIGCQLNIFFIHTFFLHLQDELAERSMQLEKVKKAGKVLTSTHDRLGALLERVSQRAEQLQTAVAQSVSVQEGLKALLAWLDGLALTPGPVQPTAQAVQDALTQNQKLRQELLSRQGSVEATRDSVSKLLKSADASTVSGLQGALQDLIQHYTTAQTKQAENEAELRGVLPKLESFDRLSMDLHSFMQSRERALSLGGQPDRSIEDYRHTVEVMDIIYIQHVIHICLKLPCFIIYCLFCRLNAIQSCEQQLSQFRSLSGSLLRWLQTVQEQLPAKEPSLNTDGLQRRVQQLKVCVKIVVTFPLMHLSAQYNSVIVSLLSFPSLFHLDLTEIQVAMSEVNSRYEQLGGNLQEKQSRQQVSLEMCLKAKQDTETLLQWLGPREQSLTRGQIASPSRPEVVQAQARENKALLSELSEHSGKVEDLKNTLKQLITENPDSPEAETWKQQLKDIANKTAAQRQTELETCADRLGSFASAASQLGPWLREKELMMSVLGPLSIDPNMLNTQKQQVQFMLREFETRRPQFDQLTQAAEGILSPTGEQGSGDGHDLVEVQQELADITRQWDDLTSRLSERSEQIDQAQGTSERFQTLLRELSMSAADLAERLDAQASLSAQPEALRRRLQETGEIRAELEQRKGQLAKAEELCAELSAIVAEPYLREELHKRLESVSGPLSSLEERAADGLSQLQSALSSTQQFQQMFEELRSWLDGQAGEHTGSVSDPLPCQPEALQTLLTQQEELLRGVAQQRGSYELIQAEGASLLASLPTGNERSALQAQLATLRQDWEGLNQCLSEKQVRVKETLSRAEQYKQHRDDLAPWVTECEKRETEILPSLDAAALDDALQKAKQLGLDLDRRRPLLEALNLAADQLLEQSRTGEEEVRDEKAQLNRRLDSLSEKLHGRTTQLEELGNRLREFEEGRQAVERRLEAAKHQLEVQEALGPQACSNKSLERLRSQQEMLNSLQPQVVYLRDLAKGLVQDMPQAAVESREGRQHLVQQVHDAEREFEEVTDKIEQCCSSLESRLQGVGEVQSHVRDVFSRLADLDDELDSLSPVGRDADSLASQAEAVKGFLGRLATLRAELEGHGGECTTMLRREGSSPDLLALRRETEALSRQAAKLAERGQGRLSLIEAAEERVREFYARLAELQGLLDQAEEGVNAQGVVGTEVDVIKQQLLEFKAVEREQIDSIQPKLQHVNAVGQGLIQSAAKHTDTQALEHDLETTNLRWNSLNKRVAERIAQLQEALLHCGKFQDALEPLLSWLSDTEELIANQKPPSAEYRVVKAQIQEQKLLQRLLDDRRGTVEMIMVEGERIAATAESQDRDKIQKQLQSLGVRWKDILEKASGRQQQLEELQVLALQFHETVEPLGEWLSATERRLSSAEPMGTQTSKITQQISRHKALQEEVLSRGTEVDGLEALGQSLSPLSCVADRDWLSERVGAMRNGHTELRDWCSRREAMLEQALANAQLFGEEEVEVLNWLAEVAQRLAEVSVQSYQPELLAEQHKHTLSLNEEIVSRKKTVDQAIKNGQALLKQTTGEEVLLIQEKLDGIKSRYAEMTAGSSKALRTLEQALQLATRFASAHEDLNQWLDSVEAELNNVEPDTTPAYQDRQKELKCVSAEKRLVLDTVNEVGSALLDLVPWRAREGLDRLVADANQRYRQADETITQRVQLVQAAIQRSQQYEEAVDAELAWVGETERKLVSLGPLSLEPDVTVAQLQVQRAFNIDIIRHKDTVDQLLNTREDILESCSELQREALKIKTDSLNLRYEAVSQNHAERFSALEQAQVLVARFWETYEELEPWLGETETLISQLPPPAIDTEALRQQQDQMRLLRESIAEHKPHIDKLLKIGPQLAELSAQEGTTVRQRYSGAERRYLAIKEEVKNRATALDEAFSQSAQFHDKMDPLLETLEGAVQRLRQPPPVAAEVEKIREQLAEHRAAGLELDKLLPSFSALCSRGEELITRAPHDDPAHTMLFFKYIFCRAEEREGKLQDVLDLAGKFWSDMAALLSTLRDSQEIVKELEDPGVDPSLIKQQIEAAEAIKAETDGLREELEIVRTLGADLIFACGETEKPEVKKTIDEMNAAWEGLNRTWRERMEKLDEAMTASVQYQDALQGMFDYLDNAVIKLCDMPAVGTDLSTVKQQIEELKQYKVEVYQQQIDMEKLCHQGELLLKKVTDQTDRDMIQEPLTELRHLWDNLGDKITLRQIADVFFLYAYCFSLFHLSLGQFQHALSELQSWLSHTHATLDTQRPISSDPKAIEIELAKHHVLRNDVLSHRATVETVNSAGSELLDSSPGDEASHLRDQLDELNRSWDSVLLKTEERQKLLEAALQQAEGFHGELEEFLQWLRRTESQLSAAKPTGGLPETAREQLQQHMELQVQLTQRGEQYHRLLDQGESMLLARGGEEAGPGTTQTQQNLALLQNKWASLNTKMDDRRAKLEEAVSLATGFQSSLQDTINWLTQAEQTLNMAQPPSLILDTVLFQIDEHKVFVNEVNTHREQVLALEKVGSQLRFASLKQDVVLIKNLLLSVQARWDKLVQRSLDRGRHLDEARKRAKQFHEAWRKLTDWLEEAESRLDSELEISNEPDKIKVQLAKHKEFQKALGSKQPVYDTTVRSGKAMRDKATLPADTQKLDNLLGEVRDKWDTVCGKSVERQHKLEEALLFSGQFAEALQALVDWLYRVEPQLAEDQPVHGDLDLVSNLMDSHKAFQKELGKRTSSVQALKRSARELMETGRDDTAWVKVQVQELSNRWDTVCALSVTKQTRLQQALKQAEEFRTAVQMLLEWLSEAEQTLRFRGVLPEEAETLQELLHTHRDFMQTVEEKRVDVNKAAGMGEAILAVCHPDCITTIKHWITIIRARFEEVLTWTKQHEQRLEGALTELLNNAALLEELLSWLQWAETTLVQRDTEPLPQDIPQLKTLITEHQVFMEEMTRKQPDVDKVTKTYKRKPAEPASGLPTLVYNCLGYRSLVTGGNPRLTQLCSRWQQVWLLALDRQRKLHDALDRLEELKEFANFDFDVWRKKYMRWMNHKKSRVMDFFRRIDKDQDGKITRQEFIDGILASKFPTSKLEMSAVADIFDRDGDGYIDYYEFVAALHPNKDAYRPTTDADKIEDEVTRQVAQCKCAKRFQVEQIGENKYRFFLGNQFGDSQQLRLVRILRSTVMVRVGGGWMALDEFLVKNDPCRVQHPGLKILRSDSSSSISSRIARGRTNLELREKFILPEGASQGLAAFRSRGRRSKPSSRTASPTRSSSSASQSAQSCTSLPSAPATPTASSRVSLSQLGNPRGGYSHKCILTNVILCSTSKLKRPTFHSSRGSLTGENGGATPRTPTSASGPTSRAGSRAGSRASSRRGSDASDASELMETRSACSDTSDTPRRPGAKASKIPTMKKTPSPKTPAGKK
uniref:Microtubule actin crosslinking factor 1 n=1 Tax=Pygocentrus nattereri TaxID=42514 RepID=A0AAR2IZB1_PYGNA